MYYSFGGILNDFIIKKITIIAANVSIIILISQGSIFVPPLR